MSLSAFRSVSMFATKMFIGSRHFTASVRSASLLRRAASLTTERGFTRSLWYMCARPAMGPTKITKTCGCCAVHTAGDKDLADFLADEIKMERDSEKAPGKLPSVKGFHLSTEGSDVKLTKKSDNEIITVHFNVNNSVEDENPLAYEQETEGQPPAQMVSRPPFTVEVDKGQGVVLALTCSFPPRDEMPTPEGEQAAEQYEDVIEIQEVSIHSGQWDDKAYSLPGSIMDGTLYDMLLNTMEERGVDAEFVEQLVEFSTAYEHQQYIGFLEQLKNLAVAK